MRPYLEDQFASPASSHYSGKKVRKAIELAREQVATAFDFDDPEEVIFTASGTEANNLGVKGILTARKRFGHHVISTPLDHPSVWFSIQSMIPHGFKHDLWNVDEMGHLLGLECFEKMLCENTILVSLPVSTPELGVVQSVEPVAKLLADRGVALMLDATHGGGWIPLDFSALKPSLVSLAPHRFHGPKGVGILYKRRGVTLEPLIHGGNQESGFRAGTENVAGIVGAGKACELLKQQFRAREEQARNLQRLLIDLVREKIPSSGILGPGMSEGRICNQLNLVFEGVEGEALMLMANVRGLECHTGISCVSRKLENDRISKATALPDDLFRSSLLLSWHHEHREKDIHHAVDILSSCVGKLRGMSPVWESMQKGHMASRLNLLPGRF